MDRRGTLVANPASSTHKAGMTNVIPFVARSDTGLAADSVASARTTPCRRPHVSGRSYCHGRSHGVPLGPADILVNCAGAARRTLPEELTPAAWKAAMYAKFFTYIHVIDPMVKRMVARGSGVIVNLIGNGGKVASPIHLAGGTANAALMLATTGLASAYAKQGVRVVGLNPGLTNTEWVVERPGADAALRGTSEQEALRQSLSRILLGRMAEPKEIANAAAFLASAKTSYVTGVNVTMDGAQTPVVV